MAKEHIESIVQLRDFSLNYISRLQTNEDLY